MLHKLSSFAQVDGRKLMDLYREDNMENTDYFYPDLEDKAAALERVEQDFLKFLETKFFAQLDSVYYVWEENGVWLSALRLSLVSPGLWYLEALSTHPDFRRQGCAARLLEAVLDELKAQGPFRLCDCVGKKNTPSLGVHKKCGFQVVAEAGFNYLSSEANDRCYGMEYAWGQEERR